MEQWHTFTKEFDAEVRILICDRCDDTPGFLSTDLPVSGSGVKKTDALAWCIANGFELVELNPAEPEESEFEDDFPESLGMKRVVEALKAHLWPNLTLLDAPGRMSSSSKKRLIDTRETNNTTECEENSTGAFVTKSHADIIDQMLKVDLPGAMGNPTDSHASEDSFEALFENLSAMKSKANNLPPSERKEYAKDMAFAFWRSIGGNESEIEDIVSDDDEPSICDEN